MLNPAALKSDARPSLIKPQSWLTRLDYLQHLIQTNQPLMAVFAEKGAGKTSFLGLVQTHLAELIQIQVIKAVPSLSIAQWFSEFSQHATARLLILIDDADQLSAAALEELFALIHQQNEAHVSLQVCLFAEFSLVKRLNHSDRIPIHTFELGNLTENETKTYLVENFPSRNKLYKTLTAKRLEQFYLLTGGNISRINHGMLNYFSPYSLRPLERSLLLKPLNLFALVVVLALAIMIWQNPFSTSISNEPEELPLPVVELEEPLPIKEPEIISLTSEVPVIAEEMAEHASRLPSWLEGSIRQQTQPSPRRVVDVSLEEETPDSLVLRDRVLVIPRDLASRKKHPEIRRKATAIGHVQIFPAGFTIQLLAARKQADISRFTKHHRLPGHSKIRLTKKKGQTWYVLTLGEFKNQEQARRAMSHLPTALSRLRPWVRPIKQYA